MELTGNRRKAAVVGAVVIAAMVASALTLYNWNGVFVLLGIIAGGGIAICESLWNQKEPERKG